VFRKVRLRLALGALVAALLVIGAYPVRTSEVSVISTDRFVLYIPRSVAVRPDVLDYMLSSMHKCLDFVEAFFAHSLRARICHLWEDALPALGDSPGSCICKPGSERHEVHETFRTLPTNPSDVDVRAFTWIHEYTHCVLYEVFGALPPLVDEGVACMIADDLFERNSYAQAAIMLTAGELPSLVALANWVNHAARAWRFDAWVNYSAAASLVSFIRDEYGRDAIIRMCERMPDCRVASWECILSMVMTALEETAGIKLDRLEAAWRQRIDSTEIDSQFRLGRVAAVRLLKHLHSSPDLDSLIFLSGRAGKSIGSFWNEFFGLQQMAAWFGTDRAGDMTEEELREQIDELHVKADKLRRALLYGNGE